MPTSDPNEKMENLLRAYAKMRREEAGPPPELSPYVRARLQAEIRTPLRQADLLRRRWWGLPILWWIRLAFYGGAGGVVAVLVVLMAWPKPPITFKTGWIAEAARPAAPPEHAPAAPAASPAPAASAPSLQPVGRMSLDVGGAPAGNPIAERSRASSNVSGVLAETLSISGSNASAVDGSSGLLANTDMPARPEAPILAGGRGGGRRGAGGRGGRVGGAGGAGGGGDGGGGFGGGASVASRAPEPPVTLALKDATSASDKAATPAVAAVKPPTLVQRMVRSDLAPGQNYDAAKDAGALPAAVLASFQLERTGDQIRLLDADGSEYLGRVVDQVVMQRTQAGNNGFANNGMENYGNGGGLAANGQQIYSAPIQNSLMGGFTFQVSGLNRKLNQNVTLTGDFFSASLQNYVNAARNIAFSNQSQVQNQAQGAANNIQNNINYTQQNGMAGVQVWRVTGRVQVGPSNQFDLDAVTLQP